MVTKLLVVLSSLLFFSNTAVEVKAPYTITGVVKDKQTGEPVKHVHVFTVKGEEEAVTDENGSFQFQTWNQTADLATEKEGYRRSANRLTLPVQKQTILLLKE